MLKSPRLRAIFLRMSVIALAFSASAYLSRLLLHRSFYESHSSTMVVLAESGLILSFLAFILILVSGVSFWKIGAAIGALIMAYLWFSDIAWWVMVK
jgi:hypothetical protein